MKEQFVTFEIALKLKELGFNFPCFSAYTENGNLMDIGDYADYDEIGKLDGHSYSISCLSPLWQQVIDWFREKFKYHIEIQSPDYQNENDFYWTIHVVKKIGVFGDGSSDNYYEAREQAILKCIELC